MNYRTFEINMSYTLEVPEGADVQTLGIELADALVKVAESHGVLVTGTLDLGPTEAEVEVV